MRIHVQSYSRKVGISSDKGVGRLDLRADDEEERELLTALYRAIGPAGGPRPAESHKQGVKFLKRRLRELNGL